MKAVPFIVVALGLLAGCASTIEGQQQSITLRTPGAENAECHFHNKDMMFVLRTGESMVINKSDLKLNADCRASGNRRRQLVISPQIEKATIGNAATGVLPGLAYDHVAKGMYVYPETITVDFSGVPVTAFPLPDYMRPEHRTVYQGEIERYGPDRHMIPDDRYEVPSMIRKRTNGTITGSPFSDNASGASVASPPQRLAPITEK